MAASQSRSPTSPNSSRLTAVLGESAPHLTLFTIILLLLLYGYEIFNFSLSPDEELYGYVYEHNWWLAAIAQGRWGMSLLDRVFPTMGNIPVLPTVVFCAGLGVSGCVLARVLVRNHSAQLAFVGIFVSSPLWPHLAEFNITSWQIGIGFVLLTLSLLFMLADTRLGDIGAACLLVYAIGIYESFFAWFVVLICLRHLSVLLGTAPIGTEERPRFPWLRSGLVGLAGILGYLAVRHLLIAAFSLKLNYVQNFVRLEEFTTVPSAAVARTLKRSLNLLIGSDPVFLGHGNILMLLPLLGLLIVVGSLLWRGPLKISARLLAGALLTAAFVAALSLVVVSAGTIPSRALTSLIPINAFLAAVTFSKGGRFEKLLYGALAAALFVSIWVSVSLFYTDHIARQRDQVLAVRIMTRVDNILPNPPPGRIPFIVVGAVPVQSAGPFRKLDVFGDSFFDSSHEGGNPWRVAAYLRTLGIDTLEPRLLEHLDGSYRPQVEAMPVWPAAGSVAMINDVLVIKLGPLPPA
jgi:hypothetical protein